MGYPHFRKPPNNPTQPDSTLTKEHSSQYCPNQLSRHDENDHNDHLKGKMEYILGMIGINVGMSQDWLRPWYPSVQTPK